ncbi:NAD(P)-dependent oxidoreductase [Conexibacter sp. CPCC 206217]|uniref:NAD(P)-dependent oxidoreductase n=1 Tax=Conexibacter sp. CPCC 206217 TaxID=3064574 RepID=UPI002718DD31|nr:NAD(P)-dependent oxidoreductase [Conexibacter sp. CPCC 206217]MDO8211895.1 NAD(P)-dependent oxidoreductase [Conexibacter sp. CPCC 206217]
MSKIAFLGLGRMGSPMAARLAAADHELRTWNRTPRPELVPPRALESATPAAAADGAEVVITMLADADALGGVLRGEQGIFAAAPRGCVLIDMSTIGPLAARAVAREAQAAGLDFLDAPVSGSVPAATDGSLVAMVGGCAETLRRVQPVLAAITRAQLHLGPSGAGAAMKVALNLMLAVVNQSIAETLALAAGAGIAREDAYDVLAGGALAAPYVGYKRAAFVDPANAPVAFSVDLMRKDVGLGLELAREAGVDVGVGSAAALLLDRARAAGLGGRDVSSVLELLAPAGG